VSKPALLPVRFWPATYAKALPRIQWFYERANGRHGDSWGFNVPQIRPLRGRRCWTNCGRIRSWQSRHLNGMGDAACCKTFSSKALEGKRYHGQEGPVRYQVIHRLKSDAGPAHRRVDDPERRAQITKMISGGSSSGVGCCCCRVSGPRGWRYLYGRVYPLERHKPARQEKANGFRQLL